MKRVFRSWRGIPYRFYISASYRNKARRMPEVYVEKGRVIVITALFLSECLHVVCQALCKKVDTTTINEQSQLQSFHLTLAHQIYTHLNVTFLGSPPSSLS